MKKILLSAGAIVLILAIIGIFKFSILPNLNGNNQVKTISPSAEYYANLKTSCQKYTNKNMLNCCIDSVKTMEVVGGVLFPQEGVDGCKGNLERMALRCPGSYAWCQTSSNYENEDFVPVPMDIQTINPTSKFDNKIKLPANVISEKDCADAGGEVWNTLGETDYNGKLIGKVEGLNCPCVCLVTNP
jgi:hypothetical protein